MQAKEESAQAGLHLNIKKTKIVTIEQIRNFNRDNEGAEIVVSLTLAHSSVQMERQPRNQEKAETRKGSNAEVGKITKSKSVSLDAEAKIIHAPVFPVVMFRCESWTVTKADRNDTDSFEIMVSGESPADPRDLQRDGQVAPRAN